MKQIFVKPGMIDGVPATVRHKALEGGRVPVPADGCFLPFDAITMRRIREGGLVEHAAPGSEPEVIEAPKPALVLRKAKPGDRPADGDGQ